MGCRKRLHIVKEVKRRSRLRRPPPRTGAHDKDSEVGGQNSSRCDSGFGRGPFWDFCSHEGHEGRTKVARKSLVPPFALRLRSGQASPGERVGHTPATGGPAAGRVSPLRGSGENKAAPDLPVWAIPCRRSAPAVLAFPPFQKREGWGTQLVVGGERAGNMPRNYPTLSLPPLRFGIGSRRERQGWGNLVTSIG